MADQWETMETVTDFIFLGPKIIVDGDCHHENKRHLIPWKEGCDKPRQHIKKPRHHFARTKIHIVQARHFPVVMNTCESWTVKKAEHWWTDAFKLWCWRRLLKVPWTARRSNWSIIKEIYPEYSLEGLMLKIQYFGYLMWWTYSLEKTLMLRKI